MGFTLSPFKKKNEKHNDQHPKEVYEFLKLNRGYDISPSLTYTRTQNIDMPTDL